MWYASRRPGIVQTEIRVSLFSKFEPANLHTVRKWPLFYEVPDYLRSTRRLHNLGNNFGGVFLFFGACASCKKKKKTKGQKEVNMPRLLATLSSVGDGFGVLRLFLVFFQHLAFFLDQSAVFVYIHMPFLFDPFTCILYQTPDLESWP